MEPMDTRSDSRSTVIDATPSQIHAAMRHPARIARWWGPRQMTTKVTPVLRASFVAFLLTSAMALHGVGATVHKCVINGTVTFQNMPCPTGVKRKTPTVEQLNAERQKKQRQDAGPTAVYPQAAHPPAPPVTKEPREPREPRELFTCDGRTYCSQMTSCKEARFFLARCPGTKMDGDRDGIPCEQQWCQ